MPTDRLPVLSCAELAAAEGAWLAEHPGKAATLMRRAVAAIAAETRALLGHRPASTLVLAGKGKNGADAILAALALGGRATVLLAQGEPVGALPVRALAAARRKGARIVRWDAACPPSIAGHEVVLDGILGSGFEPPLDPELRALIRWSDKLDGLRVAVDVPSGVGDRTSSPCFRADLTVSIGCLKSPLLRPAVARAAGRIRVADIGLPLGLGESRCVTPEALGPLRAPRPARTEKRAQGRLLIIGGSRDMPGAVVMNAEAALRAGAGLVTVAAPAAIHGRAALALPEAMWIPVPAARGGAPVARLPQAAGRACDLADTVVVGSGLGQGGVRLALATARRIRGVAVLDADALRPEVVRAARQAAGRVLLPHAGEFRRVTGRAASPAAALQAARRLKAIIVLKGPLTCVTDGRTLTHIPLGGPVLARGGSGDLLAGIVAATVARRASLGLDLLDAVIAATAWHGAAADWLARHEGESAVRTTQLLDGLSPTLRGR